MCARLQDMAVAHDHDLVRILDGGEPVGHHEAGAALHEPVEGMLDMQLRAGVDVRRGLVEDQDGGLGEEDARDAEELALAGGKRGRVPAEHGVVALGELLDELVRMCLMGCGFDLVEGRCGPSHRDVFAHGGVLHPGVLQDHADLGSQAGAREVADIVAVEADRPPVDVVEAHEQVDEGRLAAAGWADDRDALAGSHVEIEIADERAFGRVGKAHVLDIDQSCRIGQDNRIRLVGQDLVLGQQVEEAGGAGDRVLQLRDDLGDVVEGLGVLVGIAEEGREAAHGHAAAENHEGTEDADARIDEVVDEAGARVGEGGVEDRLELALAQVLADAVELATGVVGMAEGLDARDAAEHLAGVGGHGAAPLGLVAEVPVALLGDEAGEQERQGCDADDHERHLHIQAEHENKGEYDREDTGEELLECHDQAV